MQRSTGLKMTSQLKIIFLLAGSGVFVLATGSYQSYQSSNWAGQYCASQDGCFHPEWIFVGTALLIAAFLIYRRDAPSS